MVLSPMVPSLVLPKVPSLVVQWSQGLWSWAWEFWAHYFQVRWSQSSPVQCAWWFQFLWFSLSWAWGFGSCYVVSTVVVAIFAGFSLSQHSWGESNQAFPRSSALLALTWWSLFCLTFCLLLLAQLVRAVQANLTPLISRTSLATDARGWGL